MAEPINIQDMIDGRLDIKSLGEAANGDENTQVVTRTGETYPSAKKAIKEGVTKLFENGGLPAKPFPTKAMMTTEGAALPDGGYAMVTDEQGVDAINNGLYVKKMGVWSKSSYDVTSIARAEATLAANTAKSEAIATSTGQAKSYTDSAIAKIEIGTPTLSGEALYAKALSGSGRFTAIWSEYNKPVWYVGNMAFVDAVGATVKVVKEEMVFTLKATLENQRFDLPVPLPITSADPKVYVDWGDGTTSEIFGYDANHTYACAVGDEFVVRVTGAPKAFAFGNPVPGRNANYMLKSIDKNTLPKTMNAVSLKSCINLQSVCDGFLSSYNGTDLNLELSTNCPSLILTSNMFLGLGQVTNIDRLLSRTHASPTTQNIPPNLFDTFVNVTSAANLFNGLPAGATLPVGVLDKMINLENVNSMFRYSTKATLDNRIFRNQAKLKNVGACFEYASAMVADASILYADMVRGTPTVTLGCFKNATKMTNTASVPTEWK